VDTNRIELLSREGRNSFKGTKEEVARQMLGHIFGN